MIVNPLTVCICAPYQSAILRWVRWPVVAAIGGVFLLGAVAPHGTARAEDPVVVLHTHDEEVGPHIQKENPAVGTIRCIFEKLGRRVDIRRGPRLRNKGLLESGRIDGMFPNMPDPALDLIAVATEPFVLERWSYVQLRSSPKAARPRGETVGVVLGSNEGRFLAQENVNVFDAIPNMESLVRLLASDRIPFVMVDDWSFGAEATALGYSRDRFRSAIVRYVPLELYFSKPFVDANPTFVSMFNQRIKDCVHGGRKIAAWEREILSNEAEAILDGSHDEIVGHLKRSRTLDALDPLTSRVEALAREDYEWRTALDEDRMNTLMEAVLSNPLSDYLRHVAAEHPVITEIFVMNEDGFVIGLNRLTSDYWQGDESAALSILTGNAERHFSDFEYDNSTRRFQVKISLPILDDDERQSTIGMVSIGIDAARLFVGRMH